MRVVRESPEIYDAVRGQSLETLEMFIERGKQSYIAAGRALSEIIRGKLYRQAGYKTFAEYCEQRWGFTRSAAYHLVQAGGVVEDIAELLAEGESLGVTQARALVPLPAEQRREVIREAGPRAPVAKMRAIAGRKMGKPVADVPTERFAGLLSIAIRREPRGFAATVAYKAGGGVRTLEDFDASPGRLLARVVGVLGTGD